MKPISETKFDKAEIDNAGRCGLLYFKSFAMFSGELYGINFVYNATTER